MDSTIQGRIRQYQLLKIIGQGGMGKVYLANDLANKRKVAIKQIVIQDDKQEKILLKRFKREYYFLSSIDHPNIIKAYDFFNENEQMFLVLEFVSGLLLKDFLREYGDHLTLLDQLGLAIQISRAIEIINAIGIIHRDIKPSNIMVDHNTRLVKLLDLGIAKSQKGNLTKLTKTGTIIGTPAYMSPEQVNGNLATNSDIFSLGIVLYQLFAREKDSPFKMGTPVSTMNAICTKKLPLLATKVQDFARPEEQEIYAKLSPVIEKAISKEAHRRTCSSHEFSTQLSQIYSLWQSKSQIRSSDSKIWQPTCIVSPEQLEKLKNIGKRYKSDHTQIKSAKPVAYKKFLGVLPLIAVVLVIVVMEQGKKTKKIPAVKTVKKIEKKVISSKKYKVSKVATKDLPSPDEIPEELFQAAEEGNIEALIKIGRIYKKDRNHYEAIRWFKEAALQGDEKAMYLAAMTYKHMPQDEAKEGFIWLKKAAKKGYPEAMFRLGKCYLYGQGVSRDVKKTIKWLKKAALKGHIPAMDDLGEVYLYNEKEYAKALYWLNKVVPTGDSTSFNDLGHMYHYGKGVTKDLNIAAKYYKKAFDGGILKGSFGLGKVYYQQKKYTQALRWFNKAKERDPLALAYLGDMHYYGKGVVKNYPLALKYLQSAAGHDLKKAMGLLGKMYLRGHGTRKDSQKALHWLQKSSQKGDARAMFELSSMYRLGKGIAKDAKKAVYWTSQAAQKNHTASINNMGAFYVKGYGVKKDLEKARKWYLKSAAKKDPEALYMLGSIHYFKGKPYNYKKMLFWYLKAAKVGHARAMFLISGMYADGRGVTKDPVKARKWLHKAAQAGDNLAQDKLKKSKK